MEDRYKELEQEMIEKGSKVTPVVKEDTDPITKDISDALERRDDKDIEEPEFISPEEEKAYKKKRNKIILIVVIITCLLAAAAGAYLVLRWLGPSTKKADIEDLFNLGEDEVALIIDGELSEEKGKLFDGITYIPTDVAGSYMDDRIYVDDDEKLISYAAPDGVTDIALDEEDNGVKVMIESSGILYISLDYIRSHNCAEFTEYDSPKRIAIYHDRNYRYSIATLGSKGRLRTGPGDKYPYLIDIEEGTDVYVDTSRTVENEYQPVMTMDGISGYIPMESIRKTESKEIEFSMTPSSFEQKAIDGQVCLGWHNIGTYDYTTLPTNLGVAEPVNIVAPTWIILKNNKGAITSYANQTYADEVHSSGRLLWPTVRDFPNKKLKLKKVLGQTKTRRKLIKRLLKEAKTYGFDGLNIDFERVKSESAKAYLQFLRELTIEAHKKDIIISTDNYPIQEYNLFYNPDEQGRVVDYVIFMAYDEHYAGSSEAGSVSSIGYVNDTIAQAIKRIDKQRIVIGLPFFTRLWTETTKKDELTISSEVMTMSDAEGWLWSTGAKATWDKESAQYYAENKVSKKKLQRVWIENERSIKKKLSAITDNELAGVGFWAMNIERAITWETITESLK